MFTRCVLECHWCGPVLKDWRDGLIRTEHDLQASLYHHLRASGLFDPKGLFVEPAIGDYRPDLCIVLEQETWIVELKVQYKTSQGVVWEHDIRKFHELGDLAGKGQISIDSRHGNRGLQRLHAPLHFLFAVAADNTCNAVDPSWLREQRAVECRGVHLAAIRWPIGNPDHPEQPVFELL